MRALQNVQKRGEAAVVAPVDGYTYAVTLVICHPS